MTRRSGRAFAQASAPFFEEGFECAGIGPPQGDLEAIGFDGLRELWAEWLSPWSSYRSTVEDVIGAATR